MKRYFNDLDTLHRFTLSMDCQPVPSQCQHCAKTDQFVSHGFVYQKQHQGQVCQVGKRILCSDRYGHVGCGRTTRLYLVTQITRLHHSAAQMAVFVLALLRGLTIRQAYLSATHTPEPRNAYRWLGKLQRKLIAYRTGLKTQHAPPVCQFKTKRKQKYILLVTLQNLFSNLGESACAEYQKRTQTAFV